MKDKLVTYEKMCCGCGLCAEQGVNFAKNKKGFLVPELHAENLDFCDQVCPASKKSGKKTDADSVWGHYENVYLGFSKDEDVRFKASSGGVLTSTAIYLLEHNLVDGILQCGIKEDNPFDVQLFCNKTAEDVKSCVGSRYITSSPLLNIIEKIEPPKKYAFIGKPCDVIALNNYREKNEVLKEAIVYTLSFFCAGVPSITANQNLIEKMGCNLSSLRKLVYRGSGWPGYAIATDSNGKEFSMTYNDSWGKVLGRDVRTYCRFCLDGVGEQADISCGDAWYIKEGKPDFSEHQGRNIVFARTTKGDQLLKDMYASKSIELTEYKDYMSELPIIQAYQERRRTTVKGKIMALRLTRKVFPMWDRKTVNTLSKFAGIRKNLSMMKGTISRIVEGKIDL